MFKINKLFCCSHYLAGLADQAESCLKMWASIIYKDGKVVWIAQGGYSNGEPSVTRLKRIGCKSVKENGCK